MNIARVAGMWGSTSPPKPRGTTRTYRVLLLKTGTTTRATSTSDPGTVRAFHEEARAASYLDHRRDGYPMPGLSRVHAR